MRSRRPLVLVVRANGDLATITGSEFRVART
jgi:hypothetical protein